MASYPPMAVSLLLVYVSALSLLHSASSSSGSLSSCLPESALFLYNLQSQCPLSISSKAPLQVDGNFIELALSGKEGIGYISVLFYDCQCPFSHNMLPKFETLSAMFPQVEHLALEKSSALPSIFSRHGIHSLPAILLVNQTFSVRYCGSKDLISLVQFYERNTGFEPVQYFANDQHNSLRTDRKSIIKSWMGLSMKEIISREPYLVFSILFLCLRIFFSVFPKVLLCLRAFWASYVPPLNLKICGETSQVIMGRILHVVDVGRIWAKLRLSKARSFHERARSARVWASSLASVSLGESSSVRSSSQGLN